MYTITFYSFKGGVGRTMALVNVGLELVRRGRRVLLVDFDLEAPGLSTYEALRHPDHPGVVEFVSEYIRSREAPDISRFLYPVDLAQARRRRKGRKADKQAAEAKSQRSTGRLWVMPAGKGDAAYAAALAAINWNSLYENLDGYLFFEDTKLQWQQAIQPDYVLIDSRTGHTDVGGICTRQLADAVVLLFTPNQQNLAGLETVCRDIRREEKEGLKKTIHVHFVASNVPDLDDERGLLRRQLEMFKQKLTMYREFPRHPHAVIHRYESLEMLEQPVFVLQRPRSRLAREYRRLLQRLIMENPVDREGAMFYLRGLQRDRELRRMWPSARIGSVSDRLSQIEDQFKDDPTILRRLAWWYQGLGELHLALRHFNSVLQLRPTWPDALFERGRYRRQVQDKTGAAEDLLQYLRSPDYFPSEWMKADRKSLHRLESAITALRELLDVSFGAFLQALDSPGVRENIYMQSWLGVEVWLNAATEYLLRERCWEDAIHYVETVAVDLPTRICSDDHVNKPSADILQGEQAWYLAMAFWGKTGSLRSDLCRTALDLLRSALEQFEQQEPLDLQRMSLLYWRSGDSDKASALLDRAIEESNRTGLARFRKRGVSNWTFREASVHEFRQHCEEQRRMIRGEPIRPAFLGELPTSEKSDGP